LHCATTRAILASIGVTVPSIPLQNIPEDLFMQIQRLAKTQDRSLNAQVIIRLTQAQQLAKKKDRQVQVQVLASIRQRRFIAPKNSPSSLALLREDPNR
jgi:hypothetical protein